VLILAGRFKDAVEVAQAFMADAGMARSRYRGLMLYYLGYGTFAMKDYAAAGRALSQLAPFKDEFGVHARYLLARTHHLSDERPEAAAQYKALLADYDAQKKAAQEALKNPATLKPGQKAAMTALAEGPVPDYVLRAMFYAGMLMLEERRYPEALERFTSIAQQYPKWSLAPEAQLRRGYCMLQMKTFPAAIETLTPLAEHPQLGDQAMWWLARAQIGSVDPGNAQAYGQTLQKAMEVLRRAAERAREAGRNDPDARARRGDILLELADTMLAAKQYKEAAAMYEQVLSDGNSPDRAEEAMQRQATALHLAGQYRESDYVCQRFFEKYPKSTLTPAVLFRTAENSYLLATATAVGPEAKSRGEYLNRLFAEAIARYERFLRQYPDFPQANMARQGLATSHYRLGRYPEASAILVAVPEADRLGDLASVSYLLADCMIRQFPAETDDALDAARLIDKAEEAAKLLENFVAAQPKAPQTPDALVKLGYCYRRIAAVLANPGERHAMLLKAKQTYDQLHQQFPQHAAGPSAIFERSKCLAMMGAAAEAADGLLRFLNEPLRSSPVAPLAIVRLSALLRAQGRAVEAVKILEECRAQHESALQKDPARKDWLVMIQYEYAEALRDAGKRAEALAAFDSLAKSAANRPEGVNAAWRAVQLRRDETMGIVMALRRATRGGPPEEAASAQRKIADAFSNLRRLTENLQSQVADLPKKSKGTEPHLRMLYELAWCYRVLGEGEIETARQKLQREALDNLQRKAARESSGRPPGPGRMPEIPLTSVPPQPAEKTAREQYLALVAASPESNLAVQARFELAEMYARRENPEAALGLLEQALISSPTPAQAQAIRLRMAACSLMRKDPKRALAHAQAAAAGPYALEARYLVGEAYFQQQDWAKVIETLAPIREREVPGLVPDVTERALLRLGGAYAQTGQAELSRASLQMIVDRFPHSVWADEARYGLAQAAQMQKQFDAAVTLYTEVTRRTTCEVAAKAQIQIGLCRMAQQKYADAAQAFLLVPYTYDYPEWYGAAWCEAARAHMAMSQTAQAAKLWQRVLKEQPGSRWAIVAKQCLADNKL